MLKKRLSPDLKSPRAGVPAQTGWRARLSICVKLNDSTDFNTSMPFTALRCSALFALSVDSCNQFKIVDRDVYFKITRENRIFFFTVDGLE